MTEAAFNAILLSIVGCMFVILCGLMGFIGSRLFAKIDEIGTKLDNEIKHMDDKLERDSNTLHGRVSEVDAKVTTIAERIAVVETQCKSNHYSGAVRAN